MTNNLNHGPLVSFVLISYKQEHFIKEAVVGALAQTYSPLEIIISDDCSPDRTFEIIQETIRNYSGPKIVKSNRNPRNLGLAGNLNAAFNLCTGKFIVVQAGDDISVPERTSKAVSRWLNRETPVDLVCSYFEDIDEQSRSTGLIRKDVVFTPDTNLKVTDWRCGATGACACYSRRLIEKYGLIDSRIISEDWVLSFRAWLESGIALIDKPLVQHRTHDEGISVMHRTVKTNEDPVRRRKLRRQSAENRLAIAEEWLKAAEINDSDRARQLIPNLKKLVSIRQLEFDAYEYGRLAALKIAVLLAFKGIGITSSLKILLRQVLGRQ